MTKSALQTLYENEIVPSFRSEFNIANIHQVPKLTKVVLNVGAGEAVQDQKIIASIQEELRLISGQQPIVTTAKNSIAGFKLREGMPIGVKVTLRRQRMFEFMERLTKVALPRVRDFKGISQKSFDGRGNYTFGISEQIVFPEIDFDKVSKIRGLSVSLSTTAKDDAQGRFLLEKLGLPLRNN